MADTETEALGRVVRELRTAKKLTQEELGRNAGYATGAGVSISRLESGQLMPGVERLHGVAKALGLTWEDLELRASKLRADEPARETPPNSLGAERLEDRIKRIQQEIAARTASVTDLSEAFDAAQEHADREFFIPFIEFAERLEGAPQRGQTSLQRDDSGHAEVGQASKPLEVASEAVGQMLAGGAGSAATFALALLRGGASVVGAASVNKGLAGMIAAPAIVLLAAGSLIWMTKRNRQQQLELATQLALAEAELKATEQGFRALKQTLTRAAKILSYIAVHGGHALVRWRTQVGLAPVLWDRLSPIEQTRYQDFIEIAAAHITIRTIDAQRFLSTIDAEDLSQLIAQTDRALDQCDGAVTARV